MKKYTQQEIRDFVNKVWEPQSYDHQDVEVLVTANHVDITISRMYKAPPLNLKLLMQLAEFFGTKNINDDSRFQNEGCETCDYGSSYGFTLTVRPEEA